MMRSAAVALVALVAASVLAGCLGAEASLVASAPREANGLTITVSAKSGLTGTPDEVEYSIDFGGEKVYPPPGLETIELDDQGLASKFVEYRDFVVGNGDYHVTLGDGGTTPVYIEKYVKYVFINPYLEGEEDEDRRFLVDLTLQSARGGDPQDRIIAKGEVTLQIQYRGENGTVNESAHTVTAITNPDRTFTRLSFPVEEMDHYKGEGYYSVHVSFDNLQARGNFDVGLDPIFGTRDPPRHWVYIEEEQEDDGIIPP